MMNILITLDNRYIEPARVMLSSLLRKNKNIPIDIYVLHSCLTQDSIAALQSVLDPAHCRLCPVYVNDEMLSFAPTTDRYPHEMYYRIFAARYLPEELDRILYLDPDIVINGNLTSLYNLPIDGYFFAAATHVRETLRKINVLRLGMHQDGIYINSGVLLMNLKLLRAEQDYDDVFNYIKKYKNLLTLPDQDVISGLYSTRILPIDPCRYNMTERLFNLYFSSAAWRDIDWVRANSIIIHYCGRKKPWKENYLGKLDVFYRYAVKHIKVFDHDR